MDDYIQVKNNGNDGLPFVENILILSTEIIYQCRNYHVKMNGNDVGDIEGDSIFIAKNSAADEILIGKNPNGNMVRNSTNAEVDFPSNKDIVLNTSWKHL